jgi:hypothetical protein
MPSSFHLASDFYIGHEDFLAADVQRVVIVGNLLLKGTHDGVVLEQVGQRFVLEDVVDADYFNTRMVA